MIFSCPYCQVREEYSTAIQRHHIHHGTLYLLRLDEVHLAPRVQRPSVVQSDPFPVIDVDVLQLLREGNRILSMFGDFLLSIEQERRLPLPPTAPSLVDNQVNCTDCGAKDLDVFFKGKTWGETLCEDCYDRRVERREAKPQ
jgi:hypothetical protein